MDKIILDKKIDSILRCLARIEHRLPASRELFMEDYDAQDVVVLNITRAVQLSVDIATHILATHNQAVPHTMSESFAHLHRQGLISKQVADKMKKSVGYRNVAVHNYDDINLQITYEIAKDHLQDFKEFIREIDKEEPVESPGWHETTLQKTEQQFNTGREEIVDWQEAKKVLRKRLE